MPVPSRVLRIIGAAAVALAVGLGLGGCSVVRIAYNQAPDAAYWWLDGYFDFNEPQTLRLRADLAQAHDWHRQTQLPAYADLLKDLQRRAPDNLSPAQACEVFTQVRQRLVMISDRLEPTVVALAPQFTPAQLAHLEQQLEKRNREWRKEWLEGTPQERAQRRFKSVVERAEMFYGTLEDAQRSVVRASIAASRFDAATTYRDTLRRQQDALQTLRALTRNGTPAEIHVKAEMRALFERSLNPPVPAMREYIEAITRDGCEATARLHNSTTPQQRANAVARLKSYEDDLRVLAAQGR